MKLAAFFCALAAVAAGASLSAQAQGIADPGERAFSYCYSCHSVDPNETAELQGPNLIAILGRPVASVSGFEYSPALRAFAAGGKVWTAELLGQWIENPESLVPGTEMQKPIGPRTSEERRLLIEYLARQH